MDHQQTPSLRGSDHRMSRLRWPSRAGTRWPVPHWAVGEWGLAPR